MFNWLRRKKFNPLTRDWRRRTVPVSREARDALKEDYIAMRRKCCPWCDGRLSNDWPDHVVASKNDWECVECGLRITDLGKRLVFID